MRSRGREEKRIRAGKPRKQRVWSRVLILLLLLNMLATGAYAANPAGTVTYQRTFGIVKIALARLNEEGKKARGIWNEDGSLTLEIWSRVQNIGDEAYLRFWLDKSGAQLEQTDGIRVGNFAVEAAGIPDLSLVQNGDYYYCTKPLAAYHAGADTMELHYTLEIEGASAAECMAKLDALCEDYAPLFEKDLPEAGDAPASDLAQAVAALNRDADMAEMLSLDAETGEIRIGDTGLFYNAQDGHFDFFPEIGLGVRMVADAIQAENFWEVRTGGVDRGEEWFRSSAAPWDFQDSEGRWANVRVTKQEKDNVDDAAYFAGNLRVTYADAFSREHIEIDTWTEDGMDLAVSPGDEMSYNIALTVKELVDGEPVEVYFKINSDLDNEEGLTAEEIRTRRIQKAILSRLSMKISYKESGIVLAEGNPIALSENGEEHPLDRFDTLGVKDTILFVINIPYAFALEEYEENVFALENTGFMDSFSLLFGIRRPQEEESTAVEEEPTTAAETSVEESTASAETGAKVPETEETAGTGTVRHGGSGGSGSAGGGTTSLRNTPGGRSGGEPERPTGTSSYDTPTLTRIEDEDIPLIDFDVPEQITPAPDPSTPISDPDVPLASLPVTGDVASDLPFILFLCSAIGIVVLCGMEVRDRRRSGRIGSHEEG